MEFSYSTPRFLTCFPFFPGHFVHFVEVWNMKIHVPTWYKGYNYHLVIKPEAWNPRLSHDDRSPKPQNFSTSKVKKVKLWVLVTYHRELTLDSMLPTGQ